MDSQVLRRAYLDFFVARGHVEVPSSGLVPHHPRAPLFTNAGMNQFISYFLGEEIPPYKRATSAQKCVRVRGKHDDIDQVGRSVKHFSFFEMLGNFSFGDYFKREAVLYAWELLTEVLGLEAERLWVTVYNDDDEAADIWADEIGVPREKIQRTGEDNFWEMGDTGPCGPCSEIHYDRGPQWGAGGGPVGGSETRYIELWNLVFQTYDRQSSGELVPLPKPGVDTGAGFERILMILQDVPSAWETDVLSRVIDSAQSLTGRRYGEDAEADVALRVLADHARTMSFMISDGVFPSNEDRGYVLRRIIRRAVLRAHSLGVSRAVCPGLVAAVVEVMGEAYPDLAKNADFVANVAGREEERFRGTLRSGMSLLEAELATGEVISGETAFRLHDTHGFPIDLTREIVVARGGTVDDAGFASAMGRQREQSREAVKGKGDAGSANLAQYREVVEQFGPTRFVGYETVESEARVLAVLAGEGSGEGSGELEIFLDRTPFYAEAGGQVGDTGTISTATGRARVTGTTAALPGLHRHVAVLEEGVLSPGQEALASVDAERRAAVRRNHTGTHLLHWALREVLGPHVKQHGSLVAPDRLRFDFSHYAQVSRAELDKVEDLVNAEILADMGVVTEELPRAEAEAKGAIAFFGEKYGEHVRVVHAGAHSVELCGGTHVERLGMIGPVEVISESSIGSNLRRVEALTGTATLERLRTNEARLAHAAGLLKASPDELGAAIERRLAELREAQEELKGARQGALSAEAATLAAAAKAGIVVFRRDGLVADSLRDLALSALSRPGMKVVVLGGSPEEGKVTLVAAVAKGYPVGAPALLAAPARTVGGGGGGRNPELAMAGGRDASRLDEALDAVREQLAQLERPSQ
ncbi:MAG TPA: alanine--tRNA ligase [Acidimicrobiales bacterium]|nr:alanine--tRNA ligase [Acidimicrobiales bacterium]